MKPLDFLTNSDTPKLTDAEAAQLRCVALSVFHLYALQHAELVTGAIRGRPSRKLTPRGAQALAAYDAEQRRAIRVEAMRECWHAVYPCASGMDAADAIEALIAEEESDG